MKKETIFTATNKIVLNEFVDSIMQSIDWSTVYSKLRMLSATMGLLGAREYNVELDLHKSSISFNGENVDFEFYLIETETSMEIYLFFPEMEQYHATVTSVDDIYMELRALVENTTTVLNAS